MIDLNPPDLNILSNNKNTFIKEFLHGKNSKFDIAAAFQSWIAEQKINYSPEIIFAEGPEEAKSIFSRIGSVPKSTDVCNKIKVSRFESAKNCLQNLNSNLETNIEEQLRKMIFWDLNFQISQAVYSQIGNSQLVNTLTQGTGFQESGINFGDADWLGYYQLLKNSIKLDIELDHHAYELIDNGVYQTFLSDKYCVVLLRPSEIHRNNNLVLHNEEGPAVRWEDGSALYFWNGIEVTKKLIEEPELITKKDILEEKNVEVRRCIQEALGGERFANLLGLVELDIKPDRFGNIMILYRTKDTDSLIGEYIQFAKVICPTTGRNYFLCVPPSIRSVEEAVAWTFGKSISEYKPEKET